MELKSNKLLAHIAFKTLLILIALYITTKIFRVWRYWAFKGCSYDINKYNCNDLFYKKFYWREKK